MEKPSFLNRMKRVLTGIENLPEWKPVTILNLSPEQALYHESGTTSKKLNYQAMPVFNDDNVTDYGTPYFKVPIEKCISANLFSLDPAKWHPYATPLRWYRSGRHEESKAMFFRFYKKFQPETLGDFFFGSSNYPFNDFDPGIRSTDKELLMPIPEFLHNETFEDTAFPWSWRVFPADEKIRSENNSLSRDNIPHRLYFGPESEAGIEAEWQNLTRLCDEIAINGKLTEIATSIDGYMICSSSDYRFMIRRGKHLAAVLSALGHSDIIATFTPGRPRSYDKILIRNWPKVKTGIWSLDTAEAVFRRCFICRQRDVSVAPVSD